jgi:hypothetical protein
MVAMADDARGNYLGEDWRTMNLEQPVDSYQRLGQCAILFSIPIPVRTPNQNLEVSMTPWETGWGAN